MTRKIPLWLCVGTAVCVVLCIVQCLLGRMDVPTAIIVGFLLTAAWASAYDDSGH